MEKTFGQMMVDVAVILNKVNYIEEEIRILKDNIENKFVTKAEFDPVKRLVYGVTGLILTGVIVALISLVITK